MEGRMDSIILNDQGVLLASCLPSMRARVKSSVVRRLVDERDHSRKNAYRHAFNLNSINCAHFVLNASPLLNDNDCFMSPAYSPALISQHMQRHII